MKVTITFKDSLYDEVGSVYRNVTNLRETNFFLCLEIQDPEDLKIPREVYRFPLDSIAWVYSEGKL